MPDVGDVYRVVVSFNMADITIAANTLGFAVASGSCTNAELLAGAKVWLENIYTEVLSLITNDVSLLAGPVWRMVYDAPDWEVAEIVGSITPNVTFTEISEGYAYGVAALLTFKTNHPRTFGRLFLPGLSIDQVDENIINSTDLAKMALAATEVITPFNCGTAVCTYALLCKGGSVRGCSTAHARQFVAYQRRRKPGVGQ
jgi:hypothetical protein